VSTAGRFTETLAQYAMPELAAAVRQRAGSILERWAAGVEQALPDADPLTRNQVRNSIPIVLEQLAKAIESNHPHETATLLELTKAHGVSRFHQAFDITEVIVEYRLLWARSWMRWA
jgi:hypothetical protein